MPTDEQRALWAAIRAHPLDDTPRLVYADWLQEHGDEARAEFIRVQCALEKLGPDRRKGRKERVPLESREKALLKHRDAWFTQFRTRLTGLNRWGSDDWLEQLKFRRGLLDAMQFDLASACMLAEAGDELEPVDRVGVMEMAARYNHNSVVTISRWAGAGCFVCFSISGATDMDVTAIIRPGHVRNLAHLGLWYGTVSNDAVAQLGAWSFIAGLHSLDLQDNPISDVGAFALAESPHLSNLRRLVLHRTKIGKKGACALRERFGDAVGLDAEP